MATAPIYCTHKELKRVFPQLDEFDTKTPIYGWETVFTVSGGGLSGNKMYKATDTGLITALFKDGQNLSNFLRAESYSDSSENTSEALTAVEIGVDVGDGSVFAEGDIIKIDNEKMLVTDITSNTLTVIRGFLDTSAATHTTNTDVYLGNSLSESNEWIYSSNQDAVYLLSSSDPSDMLIEAGEDFITLVTQFRTDASRYLDSKLDPNLPKNQLKDKSGNFDYMIIRTTALLAAVFMIRATDPTSEMAAAMVEEAEGNIDALNNGKAALSHQNTSDASKGVIRDVTYTGTVRPVDTRGHYSGTYDLIKIHIDTTGGAIGTATYSVWVKDSDKLGMNEGNQVVDKEIINGDYQALAGGLQVRFAGTDFNSTAAVDDIWEVEVMGWSEEVDANSLQPIRMTRRYQ